MLASRLGESASSRDRPCLKKTREERLRKTPEVHLQPPHECTHTQANTKQCCQHRKQFRHPTSAPAGSSFSDPGSACLLPALLGLTMKQVPGPSAVVATRKSQKKQNISSITGHPRKKTGAQSFPIPPVLRMTWTVWVLILPPHVPWHSWEPQIALVWIAVMGPQCLRRQKGAFWEPGGKASVLRDLRRVLVPQDAMSFCLHDF